MKGEKWASWGVTTVGPLHQRLNLPNQDSWMARHYRWGDVICISDGLGSRPKSHIGSRAACLSVLDAAKIFHRFPGAGIQDLLRLIHSLWLVRIAPFESHDCSATCIFAIRLNEKFLLAQLGDGLIACCGKSSKPVLLNGEAREWFSNMTFSLGREHRPEQWITDTFNTDKYDSVILCTDGISDDILSEKQGEFVQQIRDSYRDYSPRQRNRDIGKWLKNWPVPGHSDDKTIACLFKKRD